MTPWFVYIIQCDDASYYTGIAKDPVQRFNQHLHQPAGAKYFRGRAPLNVVYTETHANRSLASIREASIKKLSRSQKETLIATFITPVHKTLSQCDGMQGSLAVGESELHGQGLFATKPIKAGCLLGFCESTQGDGSSVHDLWVSEHLFYRVSCHFRFINHSEQPNVAYYDDLSVVALTDLDKGQELLHNYGEDWLIQDS